MGILSSLKRCFYNIKRERIVYSGFWDVPLGFVVTHKNRQYYFARFFNEEVDEWCDDYEVYLLPGLSETEVAQSWGILQDMTTAYLGKVPINRVHFDDTRRQEVSTNVFYEIDIFK
jgi:hypothetical protein